jgi:predicted nucleotidyltransferase
MSTAAGTDPTERVTVNIAKARAFLLQRAEKRQAERHARFVRAWAEFDRIAALLIESRAATRIYQWGSLLNEAHFTEMSDIDVAIEGCPSAAVFFRIYGEARALTRFPLDMVELEKIEPLHAESIRRRGRLVYDAAAGR